MTAGKGSKQRPTDKQKFDEAFDRIFRPLCTDCGKRQAPGQIHTCTPKEPSEIGSSLLWEAKHGDDEH